MLSLSLSLSHTHTHTLSLSLSLQKALAYYDHLCGKYGPVSGFYIGQRPHVLITDLEILKDILVKDFNNFMDRPVSCCI